MEQRELLDLALEAVGGNQAELARRLGRSETTVSRWVTGRNGIDFESGLRLARLTGLSQHRVIEACGLDPSLVPVPSADGSVDPQAAALLAVWPNLEDWKQRAIQVLAGLVPITVARQNGFTAAKRRVTKAQHAHDGQLPNCYAVAPRLLLAAR